MNANRNIFKNRNLINEIRAWIDLNPLANLIQLVVGWCILFLFVSLLFITKEIVIWRVGMIFVLLGVIWAMARWVADRFGENLDPGVALLWIGAILVIAESITILSFGQFPRLLHMLLPIIAVFYIPGAWSLVITLGTVVWVLISVILFGNALNQSPYINILLLKVIYLVSHVLAYTWLQERRASMEAQKLLQELSESNDQLTRYAAEATQLATVQERNRIAREIHDSLGHYLTVVGVQLEKAIAFDALNKEKSGEALHAAKRLTDQALSEVRRSVGALREKDERFTLHGALTALVHSVQQGDLIVDFRWRGDEEGLTEQQVLTLFRAVQEGLTNVQKHANASQVSIDVALDAEMAELKLIDDGVGIDKGNIAKSGYGLLGLRERVELVHGTMILDRMRSRGTKLVVTLPRNGIS